MRRSLDSVEGRRAVLIAGPTASGKSALALSLAEQVEQAGRRALIINTDSMQVYDALHVLTARPSAAEEQRVAHRLYGHVAAEVRYSAGAWLRDLAPVLAQAEAEGALPFLVGGTGLYFSALTKGIATVPTIPENVRIGWAQRLAAEGPAALHEELRRTDPAGAVAIRPSDPQRILRALEVIEATGKSLQQWRDTPAEPPLLDGASVVKLVVEPNRAELYARIEARFERMIEEGAIDEVRTLLQRAVPPNLPVMKAIGVKGLSAFLRGELTLQDAVIASKLDSRRYAKRQMTWFRNQMADWQRLTRDR